MALVRMISSAGLAVAFCTTAATAQLVGELPEETSASESPSQGDAAENAPEIVVTGTFVRSQTRNASPIVTTTSSDIARQGTFTLGAVIDNLPVNAGAQNNTDGFGQAYTGGTTNVNLRGLGVSSTLVLLDGRRQVGSAGATAEGDQFVDLNSLIPTIAINRVEILKDGASSLYGSDAVAGVVNFISYSRFRGVQLKVSDTLTTRDGHNEVQFEGLTGFGSDRFNVVLAASYLDREFLSAAKRRQDFSKRAAVSTFGFPQTYLVRGVLTPDPSCAAAAANDPNVIPPAGPSGFCSFDFGDFFPLVSAEKRILGFGRATLDLSEDISAFLQVGYARNNVVGSQPPSPSVLFSPLLPVSNPGNIFGVPVVLIGRPLGTLSGAGRTDTSSRTSRVATGIRGAFGGGWEWDASFARSENRFAFSSPDSLQDRYVAALNGVGGPNNDQFFNPLFGAVNDPAVIDDFIADYSFVARSRLDTVDAHLTGSLVELPAGPLGVALGAQHRRERLSYDYNADANANRFSLVIGGDDFAARQTTNAAFLEINAPLVTGVEVQAALRYESFSNGVDTWDPKIGILARPAPGISLRGTYGTSFRSPSLFQQNGSLVVPARVLDPVLGQQVTISQRTAADPANPLVPQTSTAYNLGATWEPDFGLTIDIDYWNFAYDNYITAQSAAGVVAADPTGSQVERGAVNQITTVRTFFQNAGSLDTDGLDVSLRQQLPDFGAGRFVLGATGTRIRSYDLTDTQRGKIDGLGNRNFLNFGVPVPKIRGNASLEWMSGIHSANIFVRYVDSYRDDSDAGYKIKSFTTVDVQYSFAVPPERFGGISPVVTAGFRNLFDRSAPDALDRTGYDPLTANPLGRLFYASFSAKF